MRSRRRRLPRSRCWRQDCWGSVDEGCAGALTETELPSHAVPLALLFFNLGVELGQLLFVGTLIAVHSLWLRLAGRPPAWVHGVMVYAIGGLAAYWTIDRTLQFWA